MTNDDDPQYAYCVKCGKPSFLCTCEEDVSAGADCVSAGADGITAEEIDTCVVCQAPISADATPGYEMHFCENCGGTVCLECAYPVVDEYGEMYFLCKTCVEHNRE